MNNRQGEADEATAGGDAYCPECDRFIHPCVSPGGTNHMKNWTQSDIRRLFDATLDGFAWEFFGAHTFKSLGCQEKIKVLRAAKRDMADRFAYEWMMRGMK